MRASRLLSILLLLQARRRMTARQLAAEAGVSVRTVYRDVEALSAADIPVYGDPGPAGGYRLLEGYRTRLTGLTPGEAGSLFLAGVPDLAAALGLGAVLAAAELKLMAALPPDLRSHAGRVRERFHLDAQGWFSDGDRPPHLAAVAAAVWDQRPLRVGYRRCGEVVERVVDSLGPVLKGGAWYLVAGIEGQVRTYRASRLVDLEALDGQFERPEGFDLETYWRSWSEGFLTRLYESEATVRLSPRGMGLLARLFDPAVRRAASASADPPDGNSWTRVVIPIESVEVAAADLLRLGPEAEVVAPPELRRRLAESVTALAGMYGCC